MEREVASVVYLGITLIGIAALLSIVIVTVSIGRNTEAEFHEEASEIITTTETTQLKSLSMSDKKVLPLAGIYSVVSKEYTAIKSITFNRTDGSKITIAPGSNGWVATTTYKSGGASVATYNFPQDYFADKLNGKAEITSTKDLTYSSYELVIEEI